MNAVWKLTLATVSGSLLFSASLGHAEDIDIYAGDSGPGDAPNVLIVIDNSANWASASQGWPGGIKQGEAELKAIRTLANEVGGDVKIGLMLMTGGTGSNHDGGYVRFHLREMTPDNKLAISELIGNPLACTAGLNELNGTPNCIYQNFNGSEKTGTADANYSAVMFEVFKYFGGYTDPAHAMTGPGGGTTDSTHFGPYRYAGDPDAKTDRFAFTAASQLSGTLAEYDAVLTDETACAHNYLIFIGNGFPTQDLDCTLLNNVNGDCSPLHMPEFIVADTASEDILETTACGTYESVEACEEDAATLAARYPGYSGFTCTLSSTCPSSTQYTTTTLFGNSACGQFASVDACLAPEGLPALHPGYSTYSCVEAEPVCSYETDLSPAEIVDNNAGCYSKFETSCVTQASSAFPDYTGLNCLFPMQTDDCKGNLSTWMILADREVHSDGKTFTMSATQQTSSDVETHSFVIKGTRTVTDDVVDTRRRSLPGKTIPSEPDNHADEWARFLYRTDVSNATGQQNVVTYTIDVFNQQQDVKQTRLLMSMANAGGGKYFAARNEQEILNALRQALSEIQSVNSVFASSSLPVSINTQGTYLNQVFIGMFRPQGNAEPRWAGNLKQYQFQFFGDEMKLADAQGDEATSPTTGFITPCADSFWSTDSGDYWNFTGSNSAGSCTGSTEAGGPYSDAPDGDVVEKGGAAQRLRGTGVTVGGVTTTSTNYASRTLLTCGACADNSSLPNFDIGNETGVTADMLGVAEEERENLINWVRGMDVDNENGNIDGDGNPITTEVRPSAHGGVIHSQPAVIDFGGTDGVVAFYGADEGIFHAVKGNQGATGGDELWGFIAPETYGRLKRLRANSPFINFPLASLAELPTAPKDYFFDGPIGVYRNLESNTAWIFPTMRRGGRAIYAFDVSTPSSPPTLKWRRGCFTRETTYTTTVATTTCPDTDWLDIGQTWSKPLVAKIAGYANPVLVFGGGYDTCDDAVDVTVATRCSGTPKGANIWFVDADDGTVLRKYPTKYSVPGDVALVKDPATGVLQQVYATDTGGFVYRVNVGDSTFSTGWTSNATADGITIASLADGELRKFLYGPDVIQYLGTNIVVAGTGDRERPLVSDYPCNSFSPNVHNRFYMIKDDELDTYPAPIIDASALVNLDGTYTEAALDEGAGWYFGLGDCEQVVNKPLTFGGVVYFGTNQPAVAGSPCATNLGTARGYAVSFLDGDPANGNSSRSVTYIGGGLPPSSIAGVVDVGGTLHPFATGGDETPLGPIEPEIKPEGQRSRTHWSKEID